MSRDDSPHHQAIKLWCDAFLLKYGVKYLVQVKDTKAIKILLGNNMSPQEIVDTAVLAWNQPESSRFWACNHQSQTICGFASALNKINTELAKVQRKHDGAF